MRIALDPAVLVLGIYAFTGELLRRAVAAHEGSEAASLGRRFARRRGAADDDEIRRMVRSLHADVKVADKLLKKTADIWSISEETDLVEVVLQARGVEPAPRAYVLLKLSEVRTLLAAIRDAAEGAGEDAETLAQLDRALDGIEARPGDYVTFGVDPWGM